MLVLLAVKVVKPIAHRHREQLGDVSQAERLEDRANSLANVLVSGFALFRVAQCSQHFVICLVEMPAAEFLKQLESKLNAVAEAEQ
jgi:hypothetical protein